MRIFCPAISRPYLSSVGLLPSPCPTPEVGRVVEAHAGPRWTSAGVGARRDVGQRGVSRCGAGATNCSRSGTPDSAVKRPRPGDPAGATSTSCQTLGPQANPFGVAPLTLLRMLDRDKLMQLRTAEEARFVASHPASAARAEEAGRSLLAGVPMPWMTRWPGAFPLFVDDAVGARFTDVDGHEYVDLCLGDTGAMTGHALPAVADALQQRSEEHTSE